ncbi:histidine kinase [Belliella sp. DSM 107340]|uniref:Histidine kinase n=1 Tax=Belliella calami TaxID=2923436 RepID=A0ABS9UT68_9BACT|nr:histidine kinase [Belliella calami]
MISAILKFNKANWLKAILIILTWVMGVAYLVHTFGPGLGTAALDVALHTFLLILAYFFLENIFRYYTPQDRQFLIFLSFPLVVSIMIFYLGKYSIELIFLHQQSYLEFVKEIQFVRLFVIFLMVLGYALLLLFHSKLETQLKIRERAEQIDRLVKEAELFQLRQQLQPHFLFNSLNSISSLVKRKPDEAREMVLQLSEFLRKTIRKENQKWISVLEEIEYLQLFIGIEKVRFGHRLEVEYQIAEECKSLRLPQLLVQPLMENAVKHGLYGVLGDVLIKVRFECQDEYLFISISNPFDSMAGQASGESFGQQAIRRRLFLLFGRNDLFKTQSHKEEFKVELKIPQNYDQSYYH